MKTFINTTAIVATLLAFVFLPKASAQENGFEKSVAEYTELFPYQANRYHINNTGAVKNDDGTYTFIFKQKCEDGDVNCLEVPAGHFDYVARYYLPSEAIQGGSWTMPKAVLQVK